MTDLFLDESILNNETEEEDSNWRMYFGGTINVHWTGVGAILISPTWANYLVKIKLRFPCTINMVKYEACIAGLKAALDMEVCYLEVTKILLW